MRDLLKLLLFLIVLIFYHGMIYAQATPAEKLQVRAIRIHEKVDLDGKLSETFWKDEHAVSAFKQREPEEGKESTERTLVDIVFDDEAIYIGARMYDSNPELIEARMQRRDVTIDSDSFMFYVDPYYDRRTGFYFGINAAGTLYDGTLLNDSWDDNSWDGVWEGKAHIDEKGWTAEMRIPYSQLRFRKSDGYVWGVNCKRVISRKNEIAYLVFTPKNGSGFVSRFPELVGLQDISPGRSIQVLPYVTSRGSFYPATEGDPLHDGADYDPGVGGDLSMGLGGGLTLNATLNPDFGQVEVDPAVVNLSDVETFYPEKRPFFIEGSSIFEFGQGGATNYWGFNWSNPLFFYSRRIGRAPQGSVAEADYDEIPDGTTIIGAGKISGKMWGTWNTGTLHAFTAKEQAQLHTDGITTESEVEPATYYEVSRMQREFNGGKQGLGFITTLAQRFFDEPQLENELNQTSFVAGADGWTFLDDNKTWVVSGYSGFSYNAGTAERITDLQESSLHYFQRPDADYIDVNPNATSLTGAVARAYLNKEKGNVFLNAAFGLISPGFDINDVGFLWRADQINMHFGSGYKWTEPRHFYRYAESGLAFFRTGDFGGDTTWGGLYQFNYVQFKNYYTLNFSFAYNPQTINDFRTRGGPKTLNLPGYELNVSGTTDSRKMWVFGAGYNMYEAEQEHFRYYNFNVEWKPVSNVSVQLSPSYETMQTPAQWVDNFEDSYATDTYGSRYVFGELSQRTFAASVRMNWTFTPALSLQVYAQPLISSGEYSNFKELALPRTYDFQTYGPGQISLVDGVYTVDPDGSGPARSFTFDNPDFNYTSLRGNAVLRWEYRPGSTMYFVWTQTRDDEVVDGDFQFGNSLSRMFNSDADNIFMVKFTYYWNF